ncbi:MAG TPA: SRPBCC domain-containing protein [Solirubrobacteraceae bacterium]|nr:SRPBCC domain-containing protein [Solirubrobacteraceae bacterium]
MKLEQSFEVAAPLERVWEALIDVERVAPCLPGAAVTGKNEDGSYNGEFKVKIGPTSAAYSGKLNMENVDATAHSATMQASGTDRRGQGGAKATIVSSVAADANGQTRVDVSTDYHITGRLARFGRGGMIEEISNRLLGDFAKNLQAMLAGGEAEPTAAQTPPAEAPPTEASAAQALASEDAPADAAEQPAEPSPAEAPDAAIEGATPVAPADEQPAAPAGGEPVAPAAEEPVAPPPPGPSTPPPPPPPPSAAPETEPISAVSLVGSVALKRAKENPAPLAALVIGFLAALRLLRRRS